MTRTFVALTVLLGVAICGCDQSPNVVKIAKAADSPQKKEELSAEEREQIEFLNLAGDAQRAFKTGKYLEAEEAITKAIEMRPKEPQLHMLQADIRFIGGKIAESIDSYDQVIKIRPSAKPHLWQRGLALYYAERFQEGKEQFEIHQTVNSQDVENAVWHLLCASKVDDLEKARKMLYPIQFDRRIPMKEIYDVFAGREKPEKVMKVAEEEKQAMTMYYACLYMGLYHEMMGEHDLAKTMIDRAVEEGPGTKNNFMLQVARVHKELRENQKSAQDTSSSDAAETENKKTPDGSDQSGA